MQRVVRAVLAVEGIEMAEEIMHMLERGESARVVATASDARQLGEAVRQTDPDVVIGTPGLLERVPIEVPRMAVAAAETVAALRNAIRAGAQGFFAWPAERDALARRVRTLAAGNGRRPAEGDGLAVAVFGARGGAGTSFVAGHLAAAVAAEGHRCTLIDADLGFGDLRSALGLDREEIRRSVADLVPVADEIDTGHLEEVLWSHPRGFRVLPAPAESGGIDVSLPLRCVRPLASAGDVVIVAVPRSMDAIVAATREADRLLCVLALDVAAFHGARRVLAALPPEDAARVEFVVNRVARAEIVPGDVARVFERQPVVLIQEDRSVGPAMDRGRLLAARHRAAREVAVLAQRLLEGKEEAA